MILGDYFYGGLLLTGGWDAHKAQLNLKLAAIVSKAFIHNAYQLQTLNQDCPILIMATGARIVKNNGLYFNCLSDHFIAAAQDQTLAMEDLFNWKWPFPRHHRKVLIQVPLRVKGVVFGRMRASKFIEQSRALVNLACDRALKYTEWNAGDHRREAMAKFCANRAGSLLPRYLMYKSIFKRMGTRLLIKEEACYGGADNATAVVAARHSGMMVAEYQHGSLSKGHNAYNFAQSVLDDSNYLQTLPDHLLVYGSWWGEQINAPVTKIVIGNPHRSRHFVCLLHPKHKTLKF